MKPDGVVSGSRGQYVTNLDTFYQEGRLLPLSCPTRRMSPLSPNNVHLVTIRYLHIAIWNIDSLAFILSPSSPLWVKLCQDCYLPGQRTRAPWYPPLSRPLPNANFRSTPFQAFIVVQSSSSHGQDYVYTPGQEYTQIVDTLNWQVTRNDHFHCNNITPARCTLYWLSSSAHHYDVFLKKWPCTAHRAVVRSVSSY